MFDLFTTFYGIDLLAMLLTFAGIYFIGNKVRSGFLIALTGNLFWFIVGVMSHSPGLLFTNLVLVALYMRAFKKWNVS